ncbi:MAG: hypothetical protein KatS3mg077_2873 [Candidatus Binatia bacterium]|nr:MAG: hypothetical protein KatS3mg077_2873 [Candidatus Binatia bacterium]
MQQLSGARRPRRIRRTRWKVTAKSRWIAAGVVAMASLIFFGQRWGRAQWPAQAMPRAGIAPVELEALLVEEPKLPEEAAAPMVAARVAESEERIAALRQTEELTGEAARGAGARPLALTEPRALDLPVERDDPLEVYPAPELDRLRQALRSQSF